MTASPSSGIKGSSISIEGKGFVASSPVDYRTYTVDIKYAGEKAASTSIDRWGSFKATFNVPVGVSQGSTNLITATVRGLPMQASTSHTVPRRYISVEPSSGRRGSELTVSGAGFPGFAQVLVQVGHVWTVPPPNVQTDLYGNFTPTTRVPDSVLPGKRLVSVLIRDNSMSKLFQVTER